MSTFDHLVWATASVDDTAHELLEAHGLVALPGGTHPAWGTRNAVVPLGGSYLELVEVADPEAPDAGFTRRIREVASAGGGPALWCERVNGIEAEAAMRGYDVVPGMRTNADGSVLSWRVAGLPQACADPAMPFLIQWDDPAAMPGAIAVEHPCGVIHRVHLEVDTTGPRHLMITTPGGDITL